MTLQVLGGMSSCGDEWSQPEYYGTASRRDPEVEDELEAVRSELDSVSFRLDAFSERIEHLLPREHSTVPLSDEERQELDALYARQQEIQQVREEQPELPVEERRALNRERSEIDRSVKRLENSIPLTEEEREFLNVQREQLAPLDARKKVLVAQKAQLTNLISMKTPGSLLVYLNDDLKLRLMESDAFADDTCATWTLTLDSETLAQGGIELESGERSLLKVWIQPERGSVDSGETH